MTSETIKQTDWIIEQRKYEIARLRAILRNPNANQTEKSIARDMLKQYETENN